MSLVWVIYFIDLFGGGGVAFILSCLGIVAFAVVLLSFVLEGEGVDFFERFSRTRWVCGGLLLWLAAAAIPSTDTSYKMLAAYGVTEAYTVASESEEVKKLSSNALKVLDKAMLEYLGEE